MERIVFEPKHVWALDVQAAQQADLMHMPGGYLSTITGPNAHTLVVNGAPVLCMGCVEVSPFRGVVWSIMSKHVGQHFGRVNRTAKTLLNALPYRRLEAEVDCDFENAHRWMRLLGFEVEAPRLRCALVDGRDAALYVRIKENL